MSDREISDKLFAQTSTDIPSASALTNEATRIALGASAENQEFIKENFSALVSSIQKIAYRLYQESEAKASGRALRKTIGPLLPKGASASALFDLFEARFPILDRFFLSLTQSRRPRAGRTFELVVTTLFAKLDYPCTVQPDLGESRPDYVIPSIERYRQYASDCVILTCKRTLRERWRQVVTEGLTGTFFLATIDEKLSGNELARMKDRRVVVVVPTDLKEEKYHAAENVISFETFFEHYLDVAMARWRASGVI